MSSKSGHPGWFWHNRQGMACGACPSCPGSDALTLFPCYRSKCDEPGMLLQCFGNPEHCPGGSFVGLRGKYYCSDVTSSLRFHKTTAVTVFDSGGEPGTCANGRNADCPGSIACLPALQRSRAECIPCQGGDSDMRQLHFSFQMFNPVDALM